MEFQAIMGAIIVLTVIIAVSIFSGRSSQKKKGAGSFVVAGAIMGTLVGGSSTVGTAQLAYRYGMSAWWFTLGGGIACLILALFYAKPFNRSGNKSLMGFVTDEYGRKNGVLASALSSIGSFINIISQLIAATAIIEVIFPEISISYSIAFSAIVMILYVIFGGVKGSGMVGMLKMLLLYVGIVTAGALVLWQTGGLSGFVESVNGIDNPEGINFYSLFARGVGKDMGACLSLILGVITTQSYAQAIFMAKGEKEAVRGALISAAMIPPLGICGILVGLYMRSAHPGIMSKVALTTFITEYMPPVLGGIVLGALFIAVVGTGAGLALGIAVLLKNDILPLIFPKNKISGASVERILIVLIMISAGALSMGPLGDTILNFAFMSMGLRGAVVFIPLCFAIFGKGRVRSSYATASIILGPSAVLIFNLLGILPFDPLFAGVLISGLVMLFGFIRNTNK